MPEHQALEHHFSVHDELGILFHQPIGTPAPRKQRCSICRQSYLKLHLVHRKQSPSADWATSAASTRCAVEAASLPASQPPTDSPSKKKKDDRHRQSQVEIYSPGYIEQCAVEPPCPVRETATETTIISTLDWPRHLWRTLVRCVAFPFAMAATQEHRGRKVPGK